MRKSAPVMLPALSLARKKNRSRPLPVALLHRRSTSLGRLG